MTAHIGTAELRFFGWHIYTATLFATSSFNPSQYAQTPISLTIDYHRKLEGRLIAERSLLEMKRQGKITGDTASAWLDLMTNAFPNVAAGDRLSGRTDGKGVVTFMHNEVITAQTVDTDFSDRFFGIWLHEASSAPEMRAQLLGFPKSQS
jgi:hypothetical protein